MDRQEAYEIAHEAGKTGAQEAFALLGINSHDPEQLERWRNNLQYLDRFHTGARLAKGTIIKTSVGAFVTGTLALIVWGFKDWIAQALVVIPLPR